MFLISSSLQRGNMLQLEIIVALLLSGTVSFSNGSQNKNGIIMLLYILTKFILQSNLQGISVVRLDKLQY